MSVVGESMTWGEAVRLTQILGADPSSRVFVAVAGWQHPIDRTDVAVRDLFDLTHELAWVQGGRKGPRPKPYPRPWDKAGKQRTKPAESLTHDEIVAALRFAGHTAPIPDRPKEA